MTVTSVHKDFDNLTLTVVADFDAPTERVWQLWADPRHLERWWGPPSHPATVEAHDLTWRSPRLGTPGWRARRSTPLCSSWFGPGPTVTAPSVPADALA